MGLQDRSNRFGFLDRHNFEVIGDMHMQKNCKQYSVELSAYFDEELEDQELLDMEAHLRDCDDCRQGLKKLKKLHSALSSLSKPPIHRRSVLDDLKAKLALDSEDDDEAGAPLPS